MSKFEVHGDLDPIFLKNKSMGWGNDLTDLQNRAISPSRRVGNVVEVT
jgi:hypothetical protein